MCFALTPMLWPAVLRRLIFYYMLIFKRCTCVCIHVRDAHVEGQTLHAIAHMWRIKLRLSGFLSSPNAETLNTVLPVMVIPAIKLSPRLLRNCNFATIMNCNTNI